MPLVCGLDFETSGLDSVKDRIIEVGAVLFDWDSATPLVLQSDMVFAGVPLTKEIVGITGITEQMLEDYGKREEYVFADLRVMIDRSMYVMAHFGNDFDKKFARETFARLNMDWPDRLWLDTSIDISWPKEITTRNLMYLSAEAGFVAPYRHRAIFDVLAMLKVASEHSLDRIVARAQEPTLYVQAIVSFDEKEKAKERGYRWYAPTKIWWKAMKLSDYHAEKDEYDFKSTLLEKAPE